MMTIDEYFGSLEWMPNLQELVVRDIRALEDQRCLEILDFVSAEEVKDYKTMAKIKYKSNAKLIGSIIFSVKKEFSKRVARLFYQDFLNNNDTL